MIEKLQQIYNSIEEIRNKYKQLYIQEKDLEKKYNYYDIVEALDMGMMYIRLAIDYLRKK